MITAPILKELKFFENFTRNVLENTLKCTWKYHLNTAAVTHEVLEFNPGKDDVCLFNFRGDWSSGIRRCDLIGRFLVQTLLEALQSLGNQTHYELPGTFGLKIDKTQWWTWGECSCSLWSWPKVDRKTAKQQIKKFLKLSSLHLFFLSFCVSLVTWNI